MENTPEQGTGSTLIDLQGLSKVFYTEEVETHKNYSERERPVRRPTSS